jgi:ATP-dependent DNA ligase
LVRNFFHAFTTRDATECFELRHGRTVSRSFDEAMLYAFDFLELDGEDLGGLPLVDRKKRLARLLGGRRLGIVSAITPMMTALRSSGTRAAWALMASSRSG